MWITGFVFLYIPCQVIMNAGILTLAWGVLQFLLNVCFNSLFLSPLLMQRTCSCYSWSILALTTSWLTMIWLLTLIQKYILLIVSRKFCFQVCGCLVEKKLLKTIVFNTCMSSGFMSLVFSNIKAHIFFWGNISCFYQDLWFILGKGRTLDTCLSSEGSSTAYASPTYSRRSTTKISAHSPWR